MFLITEWIVMMKVFQKEIYIVIYKALKILGQYQPKKNRKTGRFWMFLSVNYCVTWKICVHCSIMLKKERCVNTLYRFWECILVFCERNVSFEWRSCLWKRDFWVVFCKITHCQASCKTDFSVVMSMNIQWFCFYLSMAYDSFIEITGCR